MRPGQDALGRVEQVQGVVVEMPAQAGLYQKKSADIAF